MKLFDVVALESLGVAPTMATMDLPRSNLDCEVNPRSPGSSDDPLERSVLSSILVVAKIMI